VYKIGSVVGAIRRQKVRWKVKRLDSKLPNRQSPQGKDKAAKMGYSAVRNPTARAARALQLMRRDRKGIETRSKASPATTTIATVLDRNHDEVAFLRGVRTKEDLTVAFEVSQHASREWKARLKPVAKGRIEFMLDGSLRFFPPQGSRAKPASLDTKIAKLSANKLRLNYDCDGVEVAFDTMRQVWKDDTEVVSVATLAERLRSVVRRKGRRS